MSPLSLNKTGLWTMTVLLLLGLSLYPASGRPSFQDEDTVADEDHEQDEDLIEDHDEDERDEEESEENDPTSTPTPTDTAECPHAKEIKTETDPVKKEGFRASCKKFWDEKIRRKGGEKVGSSSGGATGGETTSKDDYDDFKPDDNYENVY